jgi:hypothetical protein
MFPYKKRNKLVELRKKSERRVKTMSIYLINNKNMPWGDWGDILWSGFAPWDSASEKVYIKRVGPYSPQIYFAQDNLLISNDMKSSIESSSLSGINFMYEVEKRKLVNVDWSKWDYTVSISNYIDELFEPEDIINEGIHDESLNDIIPNYWLGEICGKVHIFIDKAVTSVNPSDFIFINGDIDNNIDFFLGVEFIGCFVSQKAKDWLDYNCPGCFEYYLISKK